MEKGSLVEQALHQGVVDFSDERVQFKAASMSKDHSFNQVSRDKQVLEVDLGSLKSLKGNELHIDELKAKGGMLQADQQVVDDLTNSEGAIDYKLVMVGRKVE